jgi:glycosyltransferase involved in cell wall biosynthesis
MKVLSITNLCLGYVATLPEIYLYKGLVAKGLELTVIVHWPTPESVELELSGIKVIYLPIIKKIDFRVIRKLRALIRTEKFDILHLTYGKAITNALIASWGLNVKIVAFLGSLSLHWHDPFTYISFLNRRIDMLICLSDGVEEHVLKQVPRRKKKKTIRIYLGYDPQWFKDVKPAERKNLGIPDSAFVVCCVANVRKVKGVDFLVRSSDFLPENLPVWFLLVGKRSDSLKMKKMIHGTKHLNNFITVGYTEEPISYTSICDLYIQPSLSEGLGRSVIEAMCLKKPVIVTDRGGAKELVKEGVSGYVVPVKSAKAIAEKINYCYQNREMLHEIGEKARERILNDFSPQVMIEQTYDLFFNLLKRNSI